MAECSIARCSQERRLFRRELHKWNKEILYAIGLERIAEELMGARRWQIFVEPFTGLESNIPSDWSPEETCYICNAKKLPLYDPANGIIPVVDGYSSLRIDTDDHSTSSEYGTAPGSSPSCSILSPWHITTLPSQSLSPSVNQPLDLSLKPTCEEQNSQSDFSLNNSSLLKIPQIPMKSGQRRRVDCNSKRSYTEDELQAALRDIQSGKLGTRRAAVIYGIPRSTLRNKVYKLANESKSRAHCRITQSAVKGKISSKCLKQVCDLNPTVITNDTTKQVSVSASESLRRLLKHTITQKSVGSLNDSDSPQILTDVMIDNCARNAESLPKSKMIECSPAVAPVFSYVFANIHNLALGRCKENLSSQSLSALKNELRLPILPDLIRRLAEERIEIERDYFKSLGVVEKAEAESSEVFPHVILKVPSYKATPESDDISEIDHPIRSSPNSPSSSSHNFSGNKGIAVSLKELIVRSISQKDTISSSEELGIESHENQNLKSRSWSLQETMKHHVKELCTLSSSENPSSEKRTRPKRGRYRNYDRDNLARAVRAVQKGEMSVHRAGTFFGVPHSTLEYKVKERHLLRPRKRELFNSSTFIETGEPVLENHFDVLPLHRKEMKNSYEHCISTESEKNNCPSLGSFPSHFSVWQSMPFFSLDFSHLSSNNFFASQMMRKLQENAQLHENGEELEEKSESQDIGILENLIKSTLDRPTTPEGKLSFFSSDLNKTSNREEVKD